MARDIKFRAWDTQENCFVAPDKVRKVVVWGLSEGVAGTLKGAHTIELMQYTGLSDKNGVEIYERDYIYRYGGGLLGNPESILAAGFVVYDKIGFKIKTALGLVNMFNSKELEVIGNIYSNPELLTKTEL